MTVHLLAYHLLLTGERAVSKQELKTGKIRSVMFVIKVSRMIFGKINILVLFIAMS